MSRARVLPSRSARLPPATCRRHGTAHRAPHRAQVKRGIEAYAAAEAIKHAASAAPRKSDAPAAGDPTHRSGQAAAAAGGRPDRGLKRSTAGVPPLAEKRLREPDADEVQSEDAKQFAKVAAVLQEIGKDRAFVSVMRDTFNKARLLEWLQKQCKIVKVPLLSKKALEFFLENIERAGYQKGKDRGTMQDYDLDWFASQGNAFGQFTRELESAAVAGGQLINKFANANGGEIGFELEDCASGRRNTKLHVRSFTSNSARAHTHATHRYTRYTCTRTLHTYARAASSHRMSCTAARPPQREGQHAEQRAPYRSIWTRRGWRPRRASRRC